MSISAVNHKAVFSKAVIARYSNETKEVYGLAKLFPTVKSDSPLVAIEVERNNQFIAVDVKRCTDGNFNTFGVTQESLYLPPYFKEKFVINQCDKYNDVFNSASINLGGTSGKSLLNDNVKKLNVLKQKIERAIELQRWQVLQTGIVTLENGDSIDFKRLAASTKVLSGAEMWSAPTTANPYKDLQDGMAFLRNTGRSQGGEVNVIMGTDALANFLANDIVLKQADIRRINRMDINAPQYDSTTGMSFHGQVSTSDFNVNLYSYNATYEVMEGGVKVSKQYLDKDTVIMLPSDFRAKTAFGALPILFKQANGGGQYVANMATDFYIRDYVDQEVLNWIHEISSAPLAIPITIDKIYTIKTVSA